MVNFMLCMFYHIFLMGGKKNGHAIKRTDVEGEIMNHSSEAPAMNFFPWSPNKSQTLLILDALHFHILPFFHTSITTSCLQV